MADYVFFRKSRNIVSSVLHVILNLLLGVGSIVITAITKSLLIGFILIAISKWRVFAVQPRYLWLNIKSNLVDFIVGLSLIFITFFYSSNNANAWLMYTILAIIYSAWLIFIKPLTSKNGTLTQAIVAVFLGTTAAILFASSRNSLILVLAGFIIGYSASRHIMVQNDSKNITLTTLVSGLVFAEIAWIAHSWVITYNFSVLGTLFIIPQLSIILSLIIFSFASVVESLTKHDGTLKFKDIRTPVLFSATIILILLIFFSNPAFNLI